MDRLLLLIPLLYMVFIRRAFAQSWGVGIPSAEPQNAFQFRLLEEFRMLGSDWWHYLNVDDDSLLTRSEAIAGIAKFLKQDRLLVRKQWDQFNCSRDRNPKWQSTHIAANNSGGRVPHFFEHVILDLYASLGRIDYLPCTENELYAIMFARASTDQRIGIDHFLDMFEYVFSEQNMIDYWVTRFGWRIDSNGDGCLSQQEWAAYMQLIETLVKYNANIVVPKFQEIAAHRPPQWVMNNFHEEYALSCVTSKRFAFWSVFEFLQRNQVNKTANERIGQVDQKSFKLVPILASSLAIWCIACVGMCGIGCWCHRKHRDTDLLELRKMRETFKGDVHAWSMFDSDLQAATSTLKPSFVRYLGLNGLQQSTFNLFQIVHPADASSMQSALERAKDACSSPIKVRIRLELYFSGAPLESFEIKYIVAELIMISQIKSSILVGLNVMTSSVSDHATKKKPWEGANWCDILCKAPEAGTFTSHNSEILFRGSLADVIAVGIDEHWIIPFEHISLLQTVAEGGFGCVKRGVLYGSEEVAIKFARSHAEQDVSDRDFRALANEVRLLRRLRHRNIVLFNGVVMVQAEETCVQFGIVLEWVDGGNLEDYTKMRYASDAMDPTLYREETHRLLIDVSKGMLYLHSLDPKIIHRDLKPANILVRMGTPPRAKLTDFGISRIVKLDEQIRKRAGTSTYMAPEVMCSQPYDTMADVYSFGCVVFFVLTLEHPSHENQLAGAQDLVGKQHPQFLVDVACKCLQLEPSARLNFLQIFRLLSEDNVEPSSRVKSTST